MTLSPEQEHFKSTLHSQLSRSAVPDEVEILADPGQWADLGATRTDFVIAFEELGHHAVPFEAGPLGNAAQLLGAGQALLEMSVEYAKQRVQFGKPIGSYQAVKHQLADVLIGLEYARPLVYAGLESAAKIAAAEAAHRAARTALQVHGAIGYTSEYALSNWILYVQRLVPLHGTPSFHRARLMEGLIGGELEVLARPQVAPDQLEDL